MHREAYASRLWGFFFLQPAASILLLLIFPLEKKKEEKKKTHSVNLFIFFLAPAETLFFLEEKILKVSWFSA